MRWGAAPGWGGMRGARWRRGQSIQGRMSGGTPVQPTGTECALNQPMADSLGCPMATTGEHKAGRTTGAGWWISPVLLGGALVLAAVAMVLNALGA